MIELSEQLNELAPALVGAQAEISSAPADATAWIGRADGGREYRYATLASVWDAVRHVLTGHLLCVTQLCEPGLKGELRLTTMLLHESGQWLAGTAAVPLPATGPRAYGSALTYARRYSLAAITGLSIEADDDAAAAEAQAAAASDLPPPDKARAESGELSRQRNGHRRPKKGAAQAMAEPLVETFPPNGHLLDPLEGFVSSGAS